MNRNAARIMALLLSAASAAAAFAACGDSTGTTTPSGGNNNASANDGQIAEAENVETEKPYADDLPDSTDLGGYTVRLLTSDKDSFEIVEDAADVVDVEVYKRQLQVEERFNVKIEPNIIEGWGTAGDSLKNSVLAGSDDYDIFGGYGYWTIGYGTQGLMRNLKDVPNIDFDKSYWGAKFNDAMTYKDYLYFCTGDIALSYTNGVYATFVNMNKFGSKFTDDNIYQIVKDGKWSMDTMYNYIEAAYEDLNGDGQANKGDFFGWSYSKEDMIDGMSISAGVKFTEFDSDGVPQLAITKGTAAVDFAEKLEKLGNSTGVYLATSDDGAEMASLFADNSCLLMVSRLYYSEWRLREMNDDYAIIPAPKLTDAQATYMTTLHDGTTLIGIPKTVSDEGLNAATVVLEAMCADSSRNLLPVYLDVALKNKYTRDADSADMIDLIRENIVADFGFLYSDTGMNNFFRQYVTKGQGISSIIAKKESSWLKSIDKICTALEENAG